MTTFEVKTTSYADYEGIAKISGIVAVEKKVQKRGMRSGSVSYIIKFDADKIPEIFAGFAILRGNVTAENGYEWWQIASHRGGYTHIGKAMLRKAGMDEKLSKNISI